MFIVTFVCLLSLFVKVSTPPFLVLIYNVGLLDNWMKRSNTMAVKSAHPCSFW